MENQFMLAKRTSDLSQGQSGKMQQINRQSMNSQGLESMVQVAAAR